MRVRNLRLRVMPLRAYLRRHVRDCEGGRRATVGVASGGPCGGIRAFPGGALDPLQESILAVLPQPDAQSSAAIVHRRTLSRRGGSGAGVRTSVWHRMTTSDRGDGRGGAASCAVPDEIRDVFPSPCCAVRRKRSRRPTGRVGSLHRELLDTARGCLQALADALCERACVRTLDSLRSREMARVPHPWKTASWRTTVPGSHPGGGGVRCAQPARHRCRMPASTCHARATAAGRVPRVRSDEQIQYRSQNRSSLQRYYLQMSTPPFPWDMSQSLRYASVDLKSALMTRCCGTGGCKDREYHRIRVLTHVATPRCRTWCLSLWEDAR